MSGDVGEEEEEGPSGRVSLQESVTPTAMHVGPFQRASELERERMESSKFLGTLQVSGYSIYGKPPPVHLG